jgi:acyl transferase domain-containing protein
MNMFLTPLLLVMKLTIPDQRSTSTNIEGRLVAISKERSDRRWYSALSNIGVTFGQTFQALSDIRTTPDKDEATAKVALHTTRGCMVQESRYIMHPATLDACLQLVNIAASKGHVEEIDKAYLPVTIEYMSLWKRATSPTAPVLQSLSIRSHGCHHGLRSVRGEAEVFDDEGRVVLRIKATFVSFEGHFSKQSVEKPRQPYLRLVWQPDVERINGAEIQKLFAWDYGDLEDHVRLQKLKELAGLCVLDLCERVPAFFGLGNQHSNVVNFAHWLSAEQARLMEGPIGMVSIPDYVERIQSLVSDLGVGEPEAQILIKLSGKLLDILAGAPNSLDMIPEAQLDQVYERGFTRWAACKQLSKLMKLYANKAPGLRILEVGIGTGGATHVLLTALRGSSPQPDYQEYTFTGLSRTTVSTAQERFKDFRSMQFRELDIERDPLSQGFEGGSYDFVIVVDVSSVVPVRRGRGRSW